MISASVPDVRQADIRFADGVDECADQLGAADGRPGLRSDVGGQAVQCDDLTIHQDDRDLHPGFVMDRRTSGSEELFLVDECSQIGVLHLEVLPTVQSVTAAESSGGPEASLPSPGNPIKGTGTSERPV